MLTQRNIGLHRRAQAVRAVMELLASWGCPYCPALWAGRGRPWADEAPIDALLSAAAGREVALIHIKGAAEAQQMLCAKLGALHGLGFHLQSDRQWLQIGDKTAFARYMVLMSVQQRSSLALITLGC